MRRPAFLAAALVLPALPVALAAPAHAATTTICVGSPAGPCDQSVATIAQAVVAAATDGTDSVISLDDVTYSDGPYGFTAGGGEALTVRGSGPATVITLPALPALQTYVSLNGATLSDLTIQLAAANSSGDYGVYADQGSIIDTVTVDGTGTSGANGLHLRGATVTGSALTFPTDVSARGIYSEGGNTVVETTVTARTAFSGSMAGASVDTLSRVVLRPSYAGVVIDSGNVDIDDSLIDLTTTSAIGLAAVNYNNGTTPKTIHADHVTIVGGDSGAIGVLASSPAAGAQQVSTVTVANSIVRGPGTSFVAEASNDGSQAGPSTATLTATYSAYQTTGGTIHPTTGAGGVDLGEGTTTADPQFAGVGDYHPALGSPVIDAGDPAAGGPTTDLEGTDRVQDGDADDVDRRDLGAYELVDTVAPVGAFVSGPPATTNDATPTFTFGNGLDLTYHCQVDAGAEAPCTSPFTTPALGQGSHTVRIRATDSAGNVDASPAERSFVVDTLRPTTTLVRKPGKVVTARKAKFTFTSDDGAATFQCRLDKKPFRACLSPAKLKVKPGKHTFYVRAVDLADNIDATPTKYRFTKVKSST